MHTGASAQFGVFLLGWQPAQLRRLDNAGDGNLILYNSYLTGYASVIYASNTYGTNPGPFTLTALPVRRCHQWWLDKSLQMTWPWGPRVYEHPFAALLFTMLKHSVTRPLLTVIRAACAPGPRRWARLNP